jgi:hypothetical protein
LKARFFGIFQFRGNHDDFLTQNAKIYCFFGEGANCHKLYFQLFVITSNGEIYESFCESDGESVGKMCLDSSDRFIKPSSLESRELFKVPTQFY